MALYDCCMPVTVLSRTETSSNHGARTAKDPVATESSGESEEGKERKCGPEEGWTRWSHVQLQSVHGKTTAYRP